MTQGDISPNDAPSWRQALPRLFFKLAVFALLLSAAFWAMAWIKTTAESLYEQGQGDVALLVILAVILIYAILIAVPFVPGIEIALALLMFHGHSLALPLYLATMVGLSLAYFMGRVTPAAAIRSILLDLHLVKAAGFVERLAPLNTVQRTEYIGQLLPPKISGLALRSRYLVIAALVNLPGSGAIGGGGGICFIAGLSGLFSWRGMLITLAIAISPFPVFIWVAGSLGWMPWVDY